MSLPICNRFHPTRANSGKIATFYEGTPLLRPPAPASLTLNLGSELGQLKSTFSALNFICRLSWSISRHFGAIHS